MLRWAPITAPITGLMTAPMTALVTALMTALMTALVTALGILPPSRRLAPPERGVYGRLVRRLVALLVFLMFAEDGGTFYSGLMFSPLVWCQALLFEATPIKMRGFDIVMAIALFAAGRDAKGPRVRPMKSTVLLAGATTATWFVLGVLRGGDARAASWQTYLMLGGVLFAFTVAATFKTPAHLQVLAKAIIAAAMYRAVMCIIFYVFYVRGNPPFTEYITSHDDTVLWVVTLVLILVNIVEKVNPHPGRLAALCVPILVIAIQLNQRRLAWVSLVFALVVIYSLLRTGKVKRRINRGMLMLAPVVVLYVAVGWGRPERVFKPLQAFATVSTTEDASTKARNVENLGLILTANTAGSLTGTGYGHAYIAVSDKYSIAHFFDLWPYVPHNSILGLLAYTGILGFAGYWMAFPTAIFLNTRVARLSKTSQERAVGIAGVAQMVVCANQMYGDMGIFSVKAVYIIAMSYGFAMRIPIAAGVWPGAALPKAGSPDVPASPQSPPSPQPPRPSRAAA